MCKRLYLVVFSVRIWTSQYNDLYQVDNHFRSLSHNIVIFYVALRLFCVQSYKFIGPLMSRFSNPFLYSYVFSSLRGKYPVFLSFFISLLLCKYTVVCANANKEQESRLRYARTRE